MLRKLFFIVVTATLLLFVSAGILAALDAQPAAAVKANLENVRSYAAAAHPASVNYAVDAGELYEGRPGEWRKLELPTGVIASVVAIDSSWPGVVYVGAANELALYRVRSQAGGKHEWLRVPLQQEGIGGITSLALDKGNRLIYVGADTGEIFRLRDVGSSIIAAGRTQLDEPIVQLAVDSVNAGLLFARTPSRLYQGEETGLRWREVENLGSVPTALLVVNRYPATVYVGTLDRGLLTSHDGVHWAIANDGLRLIPGTRLVVDAIAADPAALDVLYVATSYLFGHTAVHQTPIGVSMSTDGGATWQPLAAVAEAPVAELLPVTGQSGAVYALTMISRRPLALGSAPMLAEASAVAEVPAAGPAWPAVFAWIVAGLVGLALLYGLGANLFIETRRGAAPFSLHRPSIIHR
ncbi:WD40/YVTN/BNR-like repeat-containing protein [Caldilinea aerophila]|uniref:Uncharacterized protein n=1 Tax=Caldilinea aerophila (strain DSM 14535 / JCM 11387 / NBRC 104270 / STL-6-O1) TaxID=926550 RepID=I0I8C8_CALAS|nr:hypothetical protein [Caldilinea aerophila]BAM01516.1 hypothetical protein CLDAP_34760 [Caldilinea aerophila DSM 14535 = NBRC 104270]